MASVRRVPADGSAQERVKDLLDFTRGPALAFALTVFVLGTAWRLASVLRRPALTDVSPARAGSPSRARGALNGIFRGMWPHREFGPSALGTSLNGYVFHLGIALVVLGYAPHIAFIHRLTGLIWPALPDAVTGLAAAATVLSLLFAMWMRLTQPVLRQISTADDFISWTVTFLPFITGMAVMGESSTVIASTQHVLYRGPLALHLLTLELLLIWFPFGKLMHAVLFAFSRGATGIRFSHRGVTL